MWKVVLLALVVGALALNAILESRDTKPAKADIGRILKLRDGDLQVRVDGPRRAPTIVLIHCYTCSMHWWDRLTPLISKRRRVVRVDLLGHGGSEKPRDGYSIANQARLVAAALDRLGVSRATVAGQSLGTQVAVALAERHPKLVERLVLMDGLPSKKYRSLPFTAQLAYTPVLGQALRRTVPDSMVEDSLSEAFADEDFDVPDQFVEDVNRMTYSSFEETPDAATEFVGERSLPDRLADLGKPALVIYGEQDEIVEPPDEAADEFRDIPRTRVVMLADTGHTPQVERPRETARLVLGFGAERRPAGRRRER